MTQIIMKIEVTFITDKISITDKSFVVKKQLHHWKACFFGVGLSDY